MGLLDFLYKKVSVKKRVRQLRFIQNITHVVVKYLFSASLIFENPQQQQLQGMHLCEKKCLSVFKSNVTLRDMALSFPTHQYTCSFGNHMLNIFYCFCTQIHTSLWQIRPLKYAEGTKTNNWSVSETSQCIFYFKARLL